MFQDDPLSGDAGLGPFPPPPLGIEADPFYAFRDELAGLCRQALQELDQLKLPGSSSPSEKLGAIAAFRNATERVLRENISHLEKVVAHIERNATEFALAPQEVASRRGFLETVQRHFAKLQRDVDLLLETHKQLANKQAHQDQLEMQRVLKAQREKQKRHRPPSSPSTVDGENYARFHQQQQMQTQDQSLEEISSTLGRLKQVGNEVYHEIEAQNTLLDDLQNDTDEAEGRMATAMNRLDKILHTSSRGHTCAILFLVGFLFGEILLVTIL
ncbi:hypothetical protein BASA81_001614 [Batrachochytrium salamandrivorans]|nr:hypothetical protein BASA81_003032 [Batrachochytrium salamandrivorans]KAH9260444.1 hypothetical protein BASA81_001614 [Batrachochytrium salamandrivorans]